MRPILFALLVVSLILTSVSAHGSKNDGVLIQGSWQIISEMERGKDVTRTSTTVTMILKNGTVTIKEDTGGKMMGTYNLNPTKKPKWINITFDGQTTQAIYELKGNLLSLCHGNSDDPRPAKIASEGNSASKFLAVFKRVK